MTTEKFHMSMPSETLAAVDLRNPNRSAAIYQTVERFFEMCRRERPALRGLFSDAECGLILDALNGTAFLEPASIALLWAKVADAMSSNGLGEKWHVGGSLIEKLQALTYAQACALVDAVERFWLRENLDPKELLT